MPNLSIDTPNLNKLPLSVTLPLILEKRVPEEFFILHYPVYNTEETSYWGFRPFFEALPKDQTGVEVGVFEGYNALGVCKYSKPKKLYLVDPYRPYTDLVGYTSVFNQDDWDEIFERAKYKLKDYPVEFIREPSFDAVKSVPNQLDFVYIDGDHRIEAVKRDLDAWYPKVRIGGLFGGHDITESDVKQVIMEWVYYHPEYIDNLKIKWNDWWIVKQ
jgi:hypothetical protein